MCMSQRLTLELSDEVYAELQQSANTVGMSIAEWVVSVLSHQGNNTNKVLHSVAKQEEARQRFRSHAGAISLGCATGAENESIDVDLARAYENEYEG